MRRRPLFSAAVYAWLAVMLLLHAAASLLLLPWTLFFDRDRRTSARFGSWLCRASIAIPPSWRPAVAALRAVDLSRPAVVVVNHCSVADVAMAVALTGAPVLCAKPWVARIPLVGFGMRLAGHVVFDSADLLQVRDAIERLQQLARTGVPVLFFPEGTRAADAELGPFEDGAFHVAVRAGVDVLPLVFHGTGELLPRGGICITDHAPTVTALPRIAPGTDRRALRDRVREVMLSALGGRPVREAGPAPSPAPADA